MCILSYNQHIIAVFISSTAMYQHLHEFLEDNEMVTKYILDW